MQHRPNPILAERLAEAMNALDMSPARLERETSVPPIAGEEGFDGVPATYIWQITQARIFPPDNKTLDRIADVLGVPAAWLTGESDVR